MITSEFKLIESIRKKVNLLQNGSENIFGIGDDCAVYRISDDRYGLFSTDISVENVHFNLDYTSLSDAGYRSMAANVSDIYAMGGKPVLALVSIGIPPQYTEQMIDELYDGILTCALKHGTFIAGGDTSKSDKLVVNISIYGETCRPVYRKGAEAGDRIYVTGNTGLSKLGLEILNKNACRDNFPKSVEKHLRPDPRIDLISPIVNEYHPTAMIDISDGLLIDLGHICEMSHCGFEIYIDNVPADDELEGFCAEKKIAASDYTLYSGEEYELIFTAKKDIKDNEHIRYIGNVTASGYILIKGDSQITIEPAGYDHFR